MGFLRRNLPNLDDWDAACTDPESGVWRITPPCGHDTWDLWAPGTPTDELGFIVGMPAAKFSALDGPGKQSPVYRPWGNNERLSEIRRWAVPWIEWVSGGKVVDIVEGFGGVYNGGGREYAVFAKVSGGTR